VERESGGLFQDIIPTCEERAGGEGILDCFRIAIRKKECNPHIPSSDQVV
jgi:hypothetical protein